MRYHRLSEKRRIAALPPKPKPAAEPKAGEVTTTEGVAKVAEEEGSKQQEEKAAEEEDPDKTPPREDGLAEIRKIAVAHRADKGAEEVWACLGPRV